MIYKRALLPHIFVVVAVVQDLYSDIIQLIIFVVKQYK